MPTHIEALILQPVHGSSIWAEIGEQGLLLCATTKRKGRNVPANLTGGAWYDYDVSGTNVTLKRDGETAVTIPTMSLEDGPLSTTFLYPVARFKVPIRPITGPDDVRALQKGDSLVAMRRTLDEASFNNATHPLTHEHQLAFVKERKQKGNNVTIEIGGLPTTKDLTDFSESYEWTSEQEERAQAGTPTTPEERFPLGTFFAKVEWPSLDEIELTLGKNVTQEDYLVGGPNGFDQNFSFDPGEVARILRIEQDPANPRIVYHANGGRDTAEPEDLHQAGIRLVRGSTLRVTLAPDTLRRLALGSFLWVGPNHASFAQGARFVLLRHDPTNNSALIAATDDPSIQDTVPHGDAGMFEADPEDSIPTAPSPVPITRVPLTLDLARGLRPGAPLWTTSTAPVGLPLGAQVSFESFSRNRIAWKTPDGRRASEKAPKVVNEGWFEADPATVGQTQLPTIGEARVPLTRAAFEALRSGSILVGAATDAALGITEGKEYAVKATATSGNEPILIVTLDSGTDRAFTRTEATAFFDLRARDAPTDPADDEDTEAPPATVAAPDTPASSGLPTDPKEAKEEEEYRRELVRDRPLKGPTFRHRQRVLNAMRRLLGEPSAGGLYTPGLYALAEYGPTYDLLRAGWLVRDASTMLIGIAGVGKTTFIKFGTRLLCGAPPRIVPHDKHKAALAEADPKTRRDLIAALRAGTLRIEGRVVTATDNEFTRLIEHEARSRREPWMIPADEDAALRIERRRRLAKKPPSPFEEPMLFMEGKSEHVIAAWAIHDAANAPAMLPPDASAAQRRQAEEAASSVSEAQGAWYREVFNSYFDYFATTFIGEAKSDPDKSPDEVLYKTKVLNVTYPDVSQIAKAIPDSFATPQGAATETVIFPEAQPIVRAPVKFVNETNRMSKALGDAFLGLLAEKEIEYRGQKFRSPDSIWWFDMNPHLGWGTLDWAFLDRIDVSVIIPSINLSAKLAYEDSRLGRRRAQEAAFVYEAPEFSLDELSEVWGDVDAVDTGDYWPDDQMADLAELGLQLPTQADKTAGHPSATFDPIYALRFSAAMLEYFVATPEGFDFSRFVSHPMKGPDPHDPRSGAGEHWEHLYERMLQENRLSRDDIASHALYAKLQRPFGFRAQASLKKYAKAIAWLRGSPKIELEDVIAVIPFVLNHRLALNYEESNMQHYFSVYDWLTRKAGTGQADGTAQGQIENVKDRLTAWMPALAQLRKLQIVHDLLVAPESAGLIKPTEYAKVIALAAKWVGPNDNDADDQSIAALAQQNGGMDGVLRQVEAEAKSLLQQVEQEKDNAVVRTLPERVQARKFTRKDVEDWEEKLGVFLARTSNRRQETALRAAIGEAQKYLNLELSFVGAGAAGFFTANDLDLDDEARYGSIVGSLISLVPDVDKRSDILPEWRLAEKRFKDELAKGTDPTTLGAIDLRLPKVGTLKISYESATPPHKLVRIDFEAAQPAKKARSMLRKDFDLEVG